MFNTFLDIFIFSFDTLFEVSPNDCHLNQIIFNINDVEV